MSELLAIVAEPARICGHEGAQHGGCKGKPINKVKAGQCPIGLEIRRCRADNKRKAKVLKATAAAAKKKAKTGGMHFELGSFKPPAAGALDAANFKTR